MSETAEGKQKEEAVAAEGGNDGVKEAAAAVMRDNVFAAIARTARTEGVAALYHGLAGELLRAFLSHGTTMLAKDVVQRFALRLCLVIMAALKRRSDGRTALSEKIGGRQVTSPSPPPSPSPSPLPLPAQTKQPQQQQQVKGKSLSAQLRSHLLRGGAAAADYNSGRPPSRLLPVNERLGQGPARGTAAGHDGSGETVVLNMLSRSQRRVDNK